MQCCHYAAHDAWKGTPHAEAWAAPTFQAAVARVGGSTACTGCHLPLTNQHGQLAAGYIEGDITRPDMQPNESWDPALMSEGVTCAACHVRDGKVLGTRSVEAPSHPVVASDELGSSKMCATCHQLTWPEADRPFYDTYGEWSSSAYADAGVRCQDCHMPLEPGPATATRFAAQPHHGFEADLARALSVLIDLDGPEIQRGESFPVSVRLQNTGAGHAVPTGSPFKTYRVTLDLVDADDKPLVDAHILDLGRVVGEEAPWPTLSDNRIGPGAEVTIDATFEVSQKTRSPTAALRLRINAWSARTSPTPCLGVAFRSTAVDIACPTSPT